MQKDEEALLPEPSLLSVIEKWKKSTWLRRFKFKYIFDSYFYDYVNKYECLEKLLERKEKEHKEILANQILKSSIRINNLLDIIIELKNKP